MRISEWFYSIQGEGFTAGKPSLFLRLSGCNFICGHFRGSAVGKIIEGKKVTWWCDTESVWKAGKEISVKDLMEEIFTKYPRLLVWIKEWLVNIIFTGGEPTLPHNIKAIEEVRAWFHDQGIYPYFEVETNASILINFAQYFHQVNASPKLGNSGMPACIRQNPAVIEALIDHPLAWFKFVVNVEEDIREIEEEWIARLGITEDRIILMPGVDKLEHIQETSRFAAKCAIERGWRFSSRLQIVTWNQTTGV